MPPVRKKAADNKPPIPFTPVEQLPDVLAVLAYGRSGTGKTTFASTFPKPMLVLDVREKGTDSISNVKGVKVGEIREWSQFEEVYWWLEKGDHDFKTIVIDQLSTLQELAMAQAMKDNDKDPAKDSVSKRDFGQAGGLMKAWCMNYRDLIDKGIHVVFLAHDRTTTTEEDNSGDERIDPSVGARLMPSVASFINGAMKIIGNTMIREQFQIVNKRKVRSVEYCMRIGPHAYYTTKTRSPVGVESPDLLVDPTFEKLMGVMKGQYSTSGVRRKK